jgi:hypothetical protein
MQKLLLLTHSLLFPAFRWFFCEFQYLLVVVGGWGFVQHSYCLSVLDVGSGSGYLTAVLGLMVCLHASQTKHFFTPPSLLCYHFTRLNQQKKSPWDIGCNNHFIRLYFQKKCLDIVSMMIWWICKDKLHMHGDGCMGDWIFFSFFPIVEMWLDCTCRSGRWVCGGSFFLLPNVEMWFNHTCRLGRRVKQSGLNTFQSLWIDQLMQLSKLLLALSWTVAALKYSVCFSNPMLLTVEPSFFGCVT